MVSFKSAVHDCAGNDSVWHKAVVKERSILTMFPSVNAKKGGMLGAFYLSDQCQIDL